MDLYDCVIIGYEQFLVLLNRKNKTVKETKVYYDEILGVENILVLLKGELKIYLDKEIISIYYNTVSKDMIDMIVQFIRNKYVKDISEKPLRMIEYDDEIDCILFRNLLDQMKETEEVKVLHFQSVEKLKKYKNTWVDVLWYRYFILQNNMFLTNNKELIVFSRYRPIKTFRDVDYGYIYTYVPLKNIETIEIKNNQEFIHLNDLIVKTKTTQLTFYANEMLQPDSWIQNFA